MHLSAQHAAQRSEGKAPASVPWASRKLGPQLLSDVFEHFPFGIVVVDGSDGVIASNRAARELVDIPAGNGDGPVTCCRIFGCGRSGTPLSGACLTEIALASGETSPEVLLELPSEPARWVAVTAAPLYADGSHIVFQVRPATAPDCSAPADAWLARPRLKVQTLGRLRVTGSHGPLDGEWVGQRPGQLFKFLLTERHHFVPLEMIAEAVWPNANNRTGNAVRHCMHILRSKLEPDPSQRGASQYILAKNGGYRLNPDCVWVDADDFEAKLSGATRAFAGGDSGTAVRLFEAAVAMYHGDYLADDPYSESAYAERERLRDLATIPLRALVELRSDEPEAALGYMQRLAEMEPFDNEIQRQLLVMLVDQGRRSRAVRLYQAFEIRLLRAFNEKPTFGLSDIVNQRSNGPISDGVARGAWSPG